MLSTLLFKCSILIELFYVVFTQPPDKLCNYKTISEIYEQNYSTYLLVGILQCLLFYIAFRRTIPAIILYSGILSLMTIKTFTCTGCSKLHFTGLIGYLLCINYIFLYKRQDTFILATSIILISILLVDYQKWVSICEYILITSYCFRI